MDLTFAPADAAATPIYVIEQAALDDWPAALPQLRAHSQQLDADAATGQALELTAAHAPPRPGCGYLVHGILEQPESGMDLPKSGEDHGLDDRLLAPALFGRSHPLHLSESSCPVVLVGP